MCYKDAACLEDMAQPLSKIEQYTHGLTLQEFRQDELRTDAVIRRFTNLAEGANRICAAIHSQKPQVPWQLLKSFRNKLVHEYNNVDVDTVWQVIENEILRLSEQVAALGASLDESHPTERI